jgi:drug/metabolite transporter (DMT)-like permease
MALGIALILTSTVVYNGSVVLLAAVARRQPRDSNLVLAVSRRASGLSAILLNLLGWGLEVGALVFIPLTLARILSVAGVGVLLGLARWALKEPLGVKELGGSGLVVLGVAAVGLEIPRFGTSSPTPEDWILLLVALGPWLTLPYLFRILRHSRVSTWWAIASGLSYALSGVFTKALADVLSLESVPVLVPLVIGVTAAGFLGFVTELEALRLGNASVTVPVILALQAVVPILCAPFLFGETWPAGVLPGVFLGGGILLAVSGTIVLSGSSGRVLTEIEGPASRGT